VNEVSAYIGLNMTEVNSSRILFLAKHFGTVETLYSSPYSAISVFDEELAKKICKIREKKEPEEEIKKTKEQGIKIVTINDLNYPEYLKTIPDPPIALYIKGEITEKDRLAIAIVGSRVFTEYGKKACEMFTEGLVGLGFTIVSGMAKGIDTIAHRSCLSKNGRTIAVLGSGLDVIYPKENKGIFDEICKNGACVSEFPLGTLPEKDNFPRRNRIISGLSLGCVVVEAKERSGALITARLALEQGREVFAVPGEITKETSKGTNRLIKDGCKMVCDVMDIVEELRHIVEIK